MSLASIQDDNRDHKDCMGRPEAVAACQVQRLNENFWPTPTRLSNCVIVDTSVSFLVVLLRSRSSFGEGFNPIIWLRSKRRYSSLNFFSTHSISGNSLSLLGSWISEKATMWTNALPPPLYPNCLVCRFVRSIEIYIRSSNHFHFSLQLPQLSWISVECTSL